MYLNPLYLLRRYSLIIILVALIFSAAAGYLVIIFNTSAGVISPITASLAPDSPTSSLLNGIGRTVGKFRLQTGASSENIILNQLTVDDVKANPAVKTWYLYSGSSLIATQPRTTNSSITFTNIHQDGLPAFIIYSNSNNDFTVKVDFNSGIVDDSEMQVAINSSASIIAEGANTLLSYNTMGAFPIQAATHVVMSAYPAFNLSVISPSGLRVPQVSALLASFSVRAMLGAAAITFDGPSIGPGDPGLNAGNSLTIKLFGNCGGWPVTPTRLQLKDEFGNLLDEILGVNLCQFQDYTFDFTNSDFVIPPGASKQLMVYGDTTSLGDQFPFNVALLDNNPANINWSINYDGSNYQYANLIFANNIFGNTLIMTGSPSIIRPYVAVDASTPSGIKIPAANTFLASFNISAAGDDIIFAGSLPNMFTVNVASLCSGTGVAGDFVLKDETDSITYDVISGVNLCDDGSYSFDFSDNTLTIPDTQTKKIHIWGDTTGFGQNNVLQLWLSDDFDNMTNWSIGFDNSNWTNAQEIFFGDLYAGVLVFDGPIIPDVTPPTITITAPTKLGVGSISDTTVRVTDNYGIGIGDVSFGFYPDGVAIAIGPVLVDNIDCQQTYANQVDCSLIIKASGDLVVDAHDIALNTAQEIEYGYVVTSPVGSGARQEILSQPVANCQAVINNSQATTNNLTVDLQVTADQTVSEMYLTNRDDFTGGSWQQFATQTIWTLAEGEGTKTVYVHVRDGLGRISPLCTDTIEYATSLPVEPTPEELPIPEPAASNNIVKLATSSTVYFVDSSNQRHPFPDANVYHSWFADFSPLTIVSQADLETMPMSDNMTIRPGTWLVKIVTDPKVYAVEPGGILRWVETEAVADSLYGLDWATTVIDVSDSLFMDYQAGDAISTITHATGSVIQYQNATEVYYIDNGQKRLINPAIFSNDYFQDKFIVNNTSPLIIYPDGLAWSDLTLVQLLESQ